jgi:dihydroorotate dehydrogenase subfamily 2
MISVTLNYYLTSLMKFIYKTVLRPILFSIDPDFVHEGAVSIGQLVGKIGLLKYPVKKIFEYKNPVLSQNFWGINFANPVGLPAGFDKEGKLVSSVDSLGFGYTTAGTVTFGAYDGNPKPWLHRLPKSGALVVNYGLKNSGVRKFAQKVKKCDKPIPQVISVGRTNLKEASASLEAGADDYAKCLKVLVEEGVGDIYEINISCPNTFGGEPFTTEGSLRLLLEKIKEIKLQKPVLLKMPISIPAEEFEKLSDVAFDFGVSALVIGNLNKDRSDPSIKDPIPQNIKGGVSGKPAKKLSDEHIAHTYKRYRGKMRIIGVGGIFSPEDAYEKIRRGASLVGLITGMIYEGPSLISQINRGLAYFLKRDGFTNISEAVGSYYK